MFYLIWNECCLPFETEARLFYIVAVLQYQVHKSRKMICSNTQVLGLNMGEPISEIIVTYVTICGLIMDSPGKTQTLLQK